MTSGNFKNMKEYGATKFKEKCLEILDHIDPEGIIITKRGKPVAKLLPIESGQGYLLGCMEGKIKIKGDIFSTGIKWDAES